MFYTLLHKKARHRLRQPEKLEDPSSVQWSSSPKESRTDRWKWYISLYKVQIERVGARGMTATHFRADFLTFDEDHCEQQEAIDRRSKIFSAASAKSADRRQTGQSFRKELYTNH